MSAVAAVAALPTRAESLARLKLLRDEFVELSSKGRYYDAAGKEWRELPTGARAILLLVAGVHANEAMTVADRSWDRLAPDERSGVRFAVRYSKRHIGALMALAEKD